MIIDLLANCNRYNTVYKGIEQAFHFLQTTDLNAIAPGTHQIDSDALYAIVQEYDTMDAAQEQMESHRKYIDVQYMISGAELVGHAMHGNQAISKEYDAKNDFMLYSDGPDFFTRMDEGTFMVFFPTDLHMPCIQADGPRRVKKIVVKVRV